MPTPASHDLSRIPPVTIGFRVESGWAVAVLLAGPASAPKVLDRRRVELSDPATPMSCQPYHAGIGHAPATATEVPRLFRAVLERAARRHRLPSTTLRERDLYPTLARTLAQAQAQVRRVVVEIGRSQGPPWGADEKAAAAAAWLALGHSAATRRGA